jgi:hypothetical protein
MRLAAAVTLAAAAVLAGCGGSSPAQQAKGHFVRYREAQETRAEAEGELRKVFGDISSAATAQDQAGVLAAVERGKHALATIYTALDQEIAAAKGLAAYGRTEADGRRLRDALRQSRSSTKLVDRELAIASRDPFLEVTTNQREVSRLSSESTRISVPAAFARRRAVRAIATTLGVEPPVDVLFDR